MIDPRLLAAHGLVAKTLRLQATPETHVLLPLMQNAPPC